MLLDGVVVHPVRDHKTPRLLRMHLTAFIFLYECGHLRSYGLFKRLIAVKWRSLCVRCIVFIESVASVQKGERSSKRGLPFFPQL